MAAEPGDPGGRRRGQRLGKGRRRREHDVVEQDADGRVPHADDQEAQLLAVGVIEPRSVRARSSRPRLTYVRVDLPEDRRPSARRRSAPRRSQRPAPHRSCAVGAKAPAPGRRQRFRFLRRDQYSGFAIDDGLRDAVDVRRNHGLPIRHRLEHHVRQPFPQRGERDDIGVVYASARPGAEPGMRRSPQCPERRPGPGARLRARRTRRARAARRAPARVPVQTPPAACVGPSARGSGLPKDRAARHPRSCRGGAPGRPRAAAADAVVDVTVRADRAARGARPSRIRRGNRDETARARAQIAFDPGEREAPPRGSGPVDVDP